MRRQRLSRSRPLLIVPLTLLVFSARFTWTQERPSASETPTQVSSLAAQFAAVPEANLRFPAACKSLSPPFAPNQASASPEAGTRLPGSGHPISLPTNNPSPRLWQPAKTDGPPVKANQFMGNVPREWLTDAVPKATRYRMSSSSGDAQYYGHRIPWADRIMLGVGKQAKFHPRVTRVIGLISPGSGGGKPSPSRWIGR